jgi:hypothetical protein
VESDPLLNFVLRRTIKNFCINCPIGRGFRQRRFNIQIVVSILIMTYHKHFFQYGASADVYSLTIIIFELFSGINPFPGQIFQIFQAKMSDKKPVIPSDFPSDLRELVIQGWSKDPKERPSIQEFKSALKKMLPREGKHQSLMLQEKNYHKEKKEQLDSKKEVDSAEKTAEKIYTSPKQGNPMS